MCPGKAPSAANGRSLSKDGNAAWAHLVDSLWARREGVSHKARLAGNGRSLAKRRNAVDGPFPARCIRQYCPVRVPAWLSSRV